MVKEDNVLEYIKQHSGELFIYVQKLMGVAITETEEIEKYYWYVKSEEGTVSEDIFWIATDKRVLQFYIGDDRVKHHTLLYYDQTGFIEQGFDKQRAILTNGYPITIKTDKDEIDFAPHESYMSKEDFRDFIEFVMNQLVNT